MSALPSNLALIAEDLARATQIDARRARRRRRVATYAIAFALLALTATAAVAAGWLFGGETPVVRVVPSLGGSPLPVTIVPGGRDTSAQDVTRLVAQHRAQQPGREGSPPLGQASAGTEQTLLDGLGPESRSLSSTATTSGGVCITLTGFGTQCVPTFVQGQDVVWFFRSTADRTTAVWGIVTDAVAGVDVVTASGSTMTAEIGNGGFYAELGDGSPARLVIHLRDGTSETVTPLPCPITTPDCTS
ncbi:MAG TPA: hypothetical protein VGK92_09440 [Gaiellales bacterium]|jgi:hypothetical protein